MSEPPASSYSYYCPEDMTIDDDKESSPPPSAPAGNPQQAAYDNSNYQYQNYQAYQSAAWGQQYSGYDYYQSYNAGYNWATPPRPAAPPAAQQNSYANVVAAAASEAMYAGRVRPVRTQSAQVAPPQYYNQQPPPPSFSKQPSADMLSVGGGQEKWSPELNDYVRRAFDSTENSTERDQLERILKQKIEYVFRNQVVIDWSKEPIPTPPSRSLAAGRGRGGINLVRATSLTARRGRGLPTGVLRPAAPRPGPAAERSPQKPFYRQRTASGSSSDASQNGREERSPANDSRTCTLLGSRSPSPKRIREKTSAKAPGAQAEAKQKRVTKPTSRFSTATVGEYGAMRKMDQRASRFRDHLQATVGKGAIAKSTSALLSDCTDLADDLDTISLNAAKIVGTMEDLEKPYLRLTRAPEPHEVRPLSVLQKSLQHVRRRWRERPDYHFVCEQFKSMRQDLTVQGIETEFTVRVYEEHADVALQVGDYEEFHQCQSQLYRLHQYGLGATRRLEFTAYRLLYYIFTLDYLGMSLILASLKPVHKDNVYIAYALRVRAAWAMSNFVKFFRLAIPEDPDSVPGNCGQVLAWSLARERREAAKRIFKIFRPSISLHFVAKSLGFKERLDECLDFLTKEFEVQPTVFMPREKIDGKAAWSAMCASSQE